MNIHQTMNLIFSKKYKITLLSLMKLKDLKVKMTEAGYTPDCVLHDIEQEQKEYSVFHHSEKLAVAFALINIPKGSPIRIMKNLRVCGDCHNAIKLISHIENRQIIQTVFIILLMGPVLAMTTGN